MVVIGGIVIVVGFVIFLKLFGVIRISKKTIETSKSSLGVISDKNLDDYQKEVALQKHAKELLLQFLLILAGSLAAFFVSYGIIWLMELAELVKVDEVIEFTLSLEFIVSVVIIFLVYSVVRRLIHKNNVQSQ